MKFKFRTLFLPALFLMAGCGDSSTEKFAETDGTRDGSEKSMGGAGGVARCTAGSCDDGKFCNGVEICSPSHPNAEQNGCLLGLAPCRGEMCSENRAECTISCPDDDGDGHAEESCGGDDCDDNDPGRYPENTEICDDSHDEDCDPTTLGPDLDKDGEASRECCNPDGQGALICGKDCDDSSQEVNTEATEVCNGVDDNCDGIVDNGLLLPFYPDVDKDGYGEKGAEAILACFAPPDFSPFATDCNDAEPASNPRIAETCDGIDNDCNGKLDAVDEDDDGDGFPDLCAGLGASVTDCDDESSSIYPGAPELCNGLDDDCDGSPAAGDDLDGDGHAATDAECTDGPYLLDDCDDTVKTTFPGAVELCNGVDDDCNEIIDDPGALCDLANADASCSVGTCSIDLCRGTFLDCDQDDATGCEEDITTSRAACGDCTTSCADDEHCIASKCEKDVAWVWASPEDVARVSVHADGGAYVVGAFQGETTTFGGYTLTRTCAGTCRGAAYAVRLDNTGAPMWASDVSGLQAQSYEEAITHPSGDLIAVGRFATDGLDITGTPFYNRGGLDAFVVRYDQTDGTPLWSREFGGTEFESVLSVVSSAASVYALIGTQSTTFRAGAFGLQAPSGWPAYWSVLVKLDAVTGAVLWARGMGASAADLVLDGEEVIVAGTFESLQLTIDATTLQGTGCSTSFCGDDIFAARFDASGAALWVRSYPGTDEENVFDVAGTAGDMILTGRFAGTIAGTEFFVDVNFNPEAFYTKLDVSDGTPLWARRPPAGLAQAATEMTDTWNWLMLSYSTGTPSFGGVTLPDAGGSADVFVGQVDRQGVELWGLHIGSSSATNYVSAYSLSALGDRAVFSGTFYGDSLDVGGQVLSGTQGSYDDFVVAIERN